MKHEDYLIHLLRRCSQTRIAPPLEKLRRIQNSVFPLQQLTSKPSVSSKWKVGLLALSLLDFGSSTESLQVEKKFIQNMLERCTFPSSCWKFYLENFDRWIRLESAAASSDAAVCRLLGFHALSQAIFHLSAQENCLTTWRKSLTLYKILLEKYTSSHEVNLKTVRHYVLITMLRNSKWDSALEMFYDVLNHMEFPSPTATGFLISRLGDHNKWGEILAIYDISLRYVSRKLPRTSIQSMGPLQKDWGTVFSMAMNNASRCQPSILFSMMDKLLLYNQNCPIKPLGCLDGNFLQSLERVSAQDRLELLSLAKLNDLLDYYKGIRGLVAQKQWVEALETFCTAMKTSRAEKECPFSRTEIGRSRLALLHSSSSSNVRTIVDKINSFRKSKDALQLNDSELECVFSKSLLANDSSFWVYCLSLLHSNFSFDKLNNKKRFLPSHAMLSLLFRNQQLPWKEGLKIFSSYLSHYSNIPPGNTNGDRKVSLSVVLDSLLRLMYANNANKEADKLVLRMSEQYDVTLPGIFLQKSNKEILQIVMSRHLKIASNTLYYILGVKEESEERIPRSLFCLHLYIKNELGRGFLDGKCLPEYDFKWLHKVPVSVHIQTLRCIGQSSVPEAAKYTFTRHYLSYLLSENASKFPSESRDESLYCIVWEAFMVFLEYSDLQGKEEIRNLEDCFFFEKILELAVKQYQSFPPFYMFLPNQLDRLLPRLSLSNADFLSITVRCRFAKKVIDIVMDLFQEGRKLVSSQLVILNGLLKLCCRIVECEKYMVDKKLSITQSSEHFLGQYGEVADYALKLVRWELEMSGSSSISSHLLLLYKTISFSGVENQNWEKALNLTSLALAQPEMHCNRLCRSESHEENSFSCVNVMHYKEFSRIFGWEVGLSFWYKYFPCEVLKNVSGNTCAVDYCFSLAI